MNKGSEITTTAREVSPVLDAGLAIKELETRFALAVRQRALLEDYIKTHLQPDKHFYRMGGDNQKPSLTKEGAELICLPHNLKPRYELLKGPDAPPVDDAPYQLTIKATLYRPGGYDEGEGIGSASSYITKKDGSFSRRQKDPGLAYNATLKMAQKSAYIAATLNSTAASEFFTQDMEDDESGGKSTTEHKSEPDPKYFCKEHKTNWFKSAKMKNYAHPIAGTKEWCNMPIEKPTPLKGEGQETHAEPPIDGAALATKGQWDEIASIGKSHGWTTANACEYVGKQAAQWKEVTQAQAADIILGWRQSAADENAKELQREQEQDPTKNLFGGKK